LMVTQETTAPIASSASPRVKRFIANLLGRVLG
jgi:hypothetical protein